MQDMNGYTLLSTIKSNEVTKDIPVIMIILMDYDLNKKLADELGVAAFALPPKKESSYNVSPEGQKGGGINGQ